METWKTFRSAILAGVCISLGCMVYLSVGGVAGAVLFCFGLLAVVHCGYKLYTGTAGFIDAGKASEWLSLLVIIIGNIAGCALAALAARLTLPAVVSGAGEILALRLSKGILPCGLLGILCGFIMTPAVKFARAGRFLPLLFGIPLFILSGFTHSIADAFYYLAAPPEAWAGNVGRIALLYLSIVTGNFIGCNFSRIVLPEGR